MHRTKTLACCRARADLERDQVAGPDLPFINPDAQSVLAQPQCEFAYDRFVLRAVAEKNVVLEIFAHRVSFPYPTSSLRQQTAA